MTNSTSINAIESKYKINLTTCSKHQLNSLVSEFNSNRIRSLNDLMMDKMFDIEKMSDIERKNLLYLAVSTDEIINILKRKTKQIYHKPINAKLRWMMPYNDFAQLCSIKLLADNGILKFNNSYNLEATLGCWFERVAMWQTGLKGPTETVYLDKTISNDNKTTLGDIILRTEENEWDLPLIDQLLSCMDKTPNRRIVMRAGETEVPMSEYILAKMFMLYHFDKKMMSKMMFNKDTNNLISNRMFLKFYKGMMLHLAEIINKEYSYAGERFTLDEDEL